MSVGAFGSARAASTGLAGLEVLLRESVVGVRSGQTGMGAGIVWGGAGLVVTNAHCAPRDTLIEVEVGGHWRQARTVAYHPRHDLALLAAPHVAGPLLETRDAASLRAGELLFAYGHPLGVHDALAMGVVHAVTRGRSQEARWIIADIRLAPGNSGGPLVDAAARLVGINTMVVNGLGVAIPAERVHRFVERALAQRAA